MKKILCITLILGFLFIDFLFFHDIFKVGEQTTVAQYLTGILSIPVIVIATKTLFDLVVADRKSSKLIH